ncbi:MAG: hypothetical protein A3I70_00540 [Deltaproteobacteria bacterium RIFCSPLOWO2_02_FULL_44_34]|nr:MAG: hypothetical protein A3I70_00540 [Deltaproteobacteria bacterium RIFCSPLOWO2_02_FULL_44_34]
MYIMLKFFFDRFSKVVYTLEVLGVLLTAAWVTHWTSFSPLTKVLVVIYVTEYLFLRFCTSKRWYQNAKRYEGIELQFKKAIIPTSYILAITSGVGYFTNSTVLLWIAIVLLAVLLHVNVILLYLHSKDKNPTPVNYYSGNKY